MPPRDDDGVVAWLRQVSPYFRRHRRKTFVVYVDGRAVDDAGFHNLVRDLVLVASVGVRLVVAFGARPQIERRLAERGISPRVVGELRVSDAATMHHVGEVVGALRLRIEAEFCFGTRGAGFGGEVAKVAGGSFVVARPAGIIEGVDLMFTGTVRSIDRDGLEARLERGEIVLLPPIGYSPTGELFNLKAKDLAAAVASELGAAKLILVTGQDGIHDDAGSLCRQLTVRQARELRERKPRGDEAHDLLDTGIRACQLGVERVHVISHAVDGAVLRELFTRDGIGTMLSSAPFDQLRAAKVEDVGGILELVRPLEEQGILVKRSREKLENEIDHFVVMVREGTVIACGALYSYADQRSGEIACIAVHPDYRGGQFGDLLLEELERRARETGLVTVFVLTTQAAQWFCERGYAVGALDDLPVARRELYNYQRNSASLFKHLG
ncbi:MAG: amino-acid N-acetyltransferase [Gammaproteobacteria bacterium]|nr:amino-acid N-acetyltransferase [Gammaproteobacteria bacterium]MCP5201334.1 amino-acid N-acetyltransferase [Gammaproteobacteria bacterium]